MRARSIFFTQFSIFFGYLLFSVVHIHICTATTPLTYSHFFHIFSGWMELFRFPHRGPLSGGAFGRGRQRLVYAPILPSASRLQVGQILEVFERHFDNHGQYGWRLVQLDIRPMHHYLHLCRDGHAALWQGLHWQSLWKMGLWAPKVELHRLHAQFYDCVQSALWRMDWIHVGLYLRSWTRLCSLLFGHCPGG